MISPQVPPESEIKGRLRELQFSETAHRTETGALWKHNPTGQHLLVPNSIQGYYPDWIYTNMLLNAEDIAKTRMKQWPGWLPRPN